LGEKLTGRTIEKKDKKRILDEFLQKEIRMEPVANIISSQSIIVMSGNLSNPCSCWDLSG